MDPLSQLPLECLQRIFHILDNDDNLFALANLLTTNNYIASAVLPFLYRDPYRSAFHQAGRGRRNREKPNSDEMLTRMLLSRLSVANLTKPVALALQLEPTDSSATGITTGSSLDYLAHIRHLNIEAGASLELTSAGVTNSLPPHQLAYIQSDEFNRLYQSNPFAPDYFQYYDDEHCNIMQKYYEVLLHQETVWCMAYPILEQLQSFTIPYMPSIKHYLKVVGRFKSLEEVRFNMNEMFEDPYYFEMSPETRRPHNDLVIQDMMRFFQEHVRLFEGRLKCVHRLGEYSMEWDDPHDTTLMDITRLLPPLKKPTRLDAKNWQRYLTHRHSTDLTHVWEFDSGDMPDSWEDTVCNSQPFFQACRSLRILKISTRRTGLFKWAVQEKRDSEWNSGSTAVGIGSSQRGALAWKEPLTSAHRIHGPVPLERAEIVQFSVSNADDIDDVVFAFSSTLKTLDVCLRDQALAPLPKSIYVGQGWVHLSALTTLRLISDSDRLVLDPMLLRHCPNLTSAQMKDRTMRYPCRDIVPCAAAHLARLYSLDLSGWPALTFDPATLSSTTILTSLIMSSQSWAGSFSSSQGFIPPVGELNRSYGTRTGPATAAVDSAPRIIRPRWTWDWQLPFLTKLHLASEFAFLFEFRMLLGCPALESLSLDILSTAADEHTRVISETDLFVPTNSNNSNSCLSPLQATSSFIRAPLVSQLTLHGEWVIGESAIPWFLTETFPSVTYLRMTGWRETRPVETLFRLLRNLPSGFDESSLQVGISPIYSPEDIARLGLVDSSSEDEDVLAVDLEMYRSRSTYHILRNFP
ncbi:hypothetical protein F5H01DRAFT_403449 [Linnemannia elongata]|nr:hypothetical protein F5H01DRAFT_403449 [Linnemannia elongata]